MNSFFKRPEPYNINTNINMNINKNQFCTLRRNSLKRTDKENNARKSIKKMVCGTQAMPAKATFGLQHPVSKNCQHVPS